MPDIPAYVSRECWVPPWQDKEALAKNICVAEHTVDNWVAQGILPPPRKRGGKLLWKWSEVDEWLTLGKPAGEADSLAERIRRGTRAEASARN